MEHDEHLTPEILGDIDVDGAAVPERRCILTGAHGPRAALIRIAVGPDNQIAADLGAKLPGRGAWIVADRTILDAAMAKGKLKGALARAFKSKQASSVTPVLDALAAIGQARKLADGRYAA